MTKFKKESKTAVILGTMLLSGFATVPVFAEEISSVQNTNSADKAVHMKMSNHFAQGNMGDLMGRGNGDKNFPGSKINPENIRKALETKDFVLFTKTLTDAGVTQVITQVQFDLFTQAYGLAKTGDIVGAQKILKDNNLATLLNGFIMGQHLQLTDAQKSAIKQAEDLMKQGKTDEAKAVIVAAGLPQPLINKGPADAQKEVIKLALNKAAVLKSEGKTDEANKVLKDAGISEKSVKKLEKEFNKDDQKERKSLVSVFKKFFKFGKN